MRHEVVFIVLVMFNSRDPSRIGCSQDRNCSQGRASAGQNLGQDVFWIPGLQSRKGATLGVLGPTVTTAWLKGSELMVSMMVCVICGVVLDLYCPWQSFPVLSISTYSLHCILNVFLNHVLLCVVCMCVCVYMYLEVCAYTHVCMGLRPEVDVGQSGNFVHCFPSYLLR